MIRYSNIMLIFESYIFRTYDYVLEKGLMLYISDEVVW